MWMKLNEMELNEREELLNLTASTETTPHYIYGSGVYGTHESEIVEQGKRNRKVA